MFISIKRDYKKIFYIKLTKYKNSTVRKEEIYAYSLQNVKNFQFMFHKISDEYAFTATTRNCNEKNLNMSTVHYTKCPTEPQLCLDCFEEYHFK